MHRTEPSPEFALARALRPLRGLLIANALLLAAVAASFWMRGGGPFGPSGAAAQDPLVYSDEGVSNVSPRQRQTMIEVLRAIDLRLASLEKRLAERPLQVQVVPIDEDR